MGLHAHEDVIWLSV